MKVNIEYLFDVDNKKVDLITIENDNNHIVKLMNYGALIAELLTPDKDGNVENIIATYKNKKDFIDNPIYLGATIGRISGRIDGGFELLGKHYDLDNNWNNTTHIHGGNKGFSYRVFDYVIDENDNEVKIIFSRQSKDMEEGFPGNLDVSVSFTLNNDNELIIDYNAISDKTTLCNLTNHAYFNLSGDLKRNILNQEVLIKASKYLELNNKLICIDVKNVKDTPMDFTNMHQIGDYIEDEYLQNHISKGYDHPWLFDNVGLNENNVVMYDKISKRKIVINTTYPSVVVYSFNYSNSENLIGKRSEKYDAICFECQYEPNGINDIRLNSSILEKGKNYKEKLFLSLV